MSRILISALVAVTISACAVNPATGRRPTPTPSDTARLASEISAYGFVFPAKVRRYTLTDTETVAGHPQDKSFRYSDGSKTRVSVFFYPTDSTAAVREPQELVVQEGQLFLESLPVGVQRGWYDSYTIAFSEPDSLDVDGRLLVGRSTAAATKRGSRINVELQYLYLLGTRFVKVRASVPAEGWQNTDVPHFAHELATVLARQLHASKHGH